MILNPLHVSFKMKQPLHTSAFQTKCAKGDSDESGAQALKEVKETFDRSIKEYRRRKKLPLFGKSIASNFPVTFEELFPQFCTDLFLLIMVPSRPSTVDNRNAIRLSWGNVHGKLQKYHQGLIRNSQFKYQVIFLMGCSSSTKINGIVAEESRIFRDILRLNYSDNYKNLSTKTVLSISWIAWKCAPKFLLKADDDTFVNVHRIVNWLMKLDHTVLYAGKVNKDARVKRNPKERYYVSYGDHPANYYKPYCAGGGYILRGKILKNISVASQIINPIVNEDAYVGMLADFLGIKPYDNPRFLPYFYETARHQDIDMCDWSNKFIIHGVYGVKHILMHTKTVVISRLPFLCKKI